MNYEKATIVSDAIRASWPNVHTEVSSNDDDGPCWVSVYPVEQGFPWVAEIHSEVGSAAYLAGGYPDRVLEHPGLGCSYGVYGVSV